MTPFGILMPAIRPLHTVKEGDKRTLQIRTRRAKDLDILRARYMLGTLGPNIHTPQFDYEYRAYCEPEDFAAALYAMVLEIDYKKFKPTTQALYEDDELHTCYNAIWSTVLRTLSTPDHRYDYWRGAAAKGGTGVSLAKPGQTNPGPYSPDYWKSPYTHSTVQPKGVIEGSATGTGWVDNTDDYVVAGGDDGFAIEQLRKALGIKDEDAEKYTGLQLCAMGWKRVDDVMDDIYSDTPYSHKACAHVFTDAADKKCDKRQTAVGEAEIDGIRKAIILVEMTAGYGNTAIAGADK